MNKQRSTAAEVLHNGARAGVLRQTAAGYSFRYDADYLGSAQPAISLTLPKQAAPFISGALFAFFYGLLAEGTAKETQCRLLHLHEQDHFARLLLTAQAETIGAVTVRPLAPDPA